MRNDGSVAGRRGQRSGGRHTYVQGDGQTDGRPQRVTTSDPLRTSKHDITQSVKPAANRQQTGRASAPHLLGVSLDPNRPSAPHAANLHFYTRCVVLTTRWQTYIPELKHVLRVDAKIPDFGLRGRSRQQVSGCTRKQTRSFRPTALVDRATKCLATADFCRDKNTAAQQRARTDSGQRAHMDSRLWLSAGTSLWLIRRW